jgi:outer membrane murein-binding lipoprotein Lpp
MDATEIPEFKPKKSLNMAQLAANMKEEMTVLFGSKPENLTFAGFRIYCLDKKEGYLSATSYLSKGIDLAAFGSEDQAVKIDPSLPDHDKKLLLRGSALIFALLEGVRTQNHEVLQACSTLWEEAKFFKDPAPTLDQVLEEYSAAIKAWPEHDDLESQVSSLESDLQDMESERDEAQEEVEQKQQRIQELEAELTRRDEELEDLQEKLKEAQASN